MTEETKQKIREAHIGKKASLEARKKMSDAKKGKPKSEEYIEKRRKFLIGRKRNERECIAISFGKLNKSNSSIFHSVRNVTTGETFNSVKAAAEKYDVEYQNISQACRKGVKCAGCYWEYMTAVKKRIKNNDPDTRILVSASREDVSKIRVAAAEKGMSMSKFIIKIFNDYEENKHE